MSATAPRRARPATRVLRRAWRALTDGAAWRKAGREEYAFATEAMRSLGAIRLLQFTIAGLALMMIPLSILAELNPMGPNTPLKLGVHMSISAVAVGLATFWLVRPWPTVRAAIWFLVLSDVSIGLAGALMSDPTARICATIHLGMLGMFAAFLLGWRIMLLHCLYSLLLIAGLTAFAIAEEGRSLADLYVYTTPAITTVVGMPVVVQVVVEFGRRGTARLAAEWNIDSLTGVFNRRGMLISVRRAVAVQTTGSSVYVVAILDLDGFKQYNDTHGHFAGDELLAQVAGTLRRALPDDLVGRNGGDEFGVFAIRESHAEALAVVDVLRTLVRPRGGAGDGPISGSIGIVVRPAGGRPQLEEQAALADAALYEAKRSAMSAAVVRDLMAAPSNPTP